MKENVHYKFCTYLYSWDSKIISNKSITHFYLDSKSSLLNSLQLIIIVEII